MFIYLHVIQVIEYGVWIPIYYCTIILISSVVFRMIFYFKIGDSHVPPQERNRVANNNERSGLLPTNLLFNNNFLIIWCA